MTGTLIKRHLCWHTVPTRRWLLGIAASMCPISEGAEDYDTEDDLDQPQPRHSQRRRRLPENVGLPADKESMRLAAALLIALGMVWPLLVAARLRAKPRSEAISGLVAAYQRRHRTSLVESDGTPNSELSAARN